MPAWLIALQLALQLEPQVAQMIQLANAPALTAEQMASLQTAMNAAVAKYDADVKA